MLGSIIERVKCSLRVFEQKHAGIYNPFQTDFLQFQEAAKVLVVFLVANRYSPKDINWYLR